MNLAYMYDMSGKHFANMFLQYLSDSDPLAEGKHWYRTAWSASGCQKCWACGKQIPMNIIYLYCLLKFVVTFIFVQP